MQKDLDNFARLSPRVGVGGIPVFLSLSWSKNFFGG